ncbi:MAG: nucleotide exchange factor GrpE [Nitrospinae bacterium]|nr:nucleotide exchange factor GrpE [Nitrospinota bacterium]MBF0633838.1 nucleotide exchange factor GrpE [Nitrospinota bacterium]
MSEEVKVEVIDKRRIKSADDTYDEALDAQMTSGGYGKPVGASDPNEAKLREFMAVYMEKMAEMDRVRKRLETEAEDRAKRKFGALVADLLPILDDMDRAIAHADSVGAGDSMVDGLRKMRDGFYSTLSAKGLTAINCANQPFDPELAQAVAVTSVDDESSDNLVLEQYAPGYLYEGQVLRHAIVRVARKD